MNNTPTKISVNKNTQILTIEWKDSHKSDISFSSLRYSCPCVECRGGHDQMSGIPPVDVFDRHINNSILTDIVKVEPVGSYGITIKWGDGHSAGIYNWEYLRLLCPCKECRRNFISNSKS